jgi:hypothetical protein
MSSHNEGKGTFHPRPWWELGRSCSRLGRWQQQKDVLEHWEGCLCDLAIQQRVWGPLRAQGPVARMEIPCPLASVDALGAERVVVWMDPWAAMVSVRAQLHCPTDCCMAESAAGVGLEVVRCCYYWHIYP